MDISRLKMSRTHPCAGSDLSHIVSEYLQSEDSIRIESHFEQRQTAAIFMELRVLHLNLYEHVNATAQSRSLKCSTACIFHPKIHRNLFGLQKKGRQYYICVKIRVYISNIKLIKFKPI